MDLDSRRPENRARFDRVAVVINQHVMNDCCRRFVVYHSEMLDRNPNRPVVAEHRAYETQTVASHFRESFQRLEVLPFISPLKVIKEVPQLPP